LRDVALLQAVTSLTPIPSAPCRLAEGPLWHAPSATLYWTDIPEGKIYRYTPATGESACCYSGEQVGGSTFNRDGTLALFRVKDVCWIDFAGKILAVQPFEMHGSHRFNDVSAGPDGSVFAGTIGRTHESGGLYHFKPDGSVRHLFAGTGCANGMGFSPDRTTFYWTCSTSRKIYAYPYQDGEIDVPGCRVFYDAPADEKTPDGMTVDRDGNIWSARWDGFQIVKIGPSGRKLDSLSLPRARVTSACFGGADLDRLYVTAAANQGEEKITPCLYELKIEGVSGHEEFFSQLDGSRPLRIVE
jgi:D-xylonolactonase